ncbi:Csu type fimbrial protein [Cellvibrio polysaccharolyticus]|uniref:SCPU domain-containing protein n=1 Tax=Cellvibrio polysaccharolyticus TaxID=2082724 RepID=A0A928V4J8_9GAMM|nr:spore coat U domain-containing protein [Cellvibrio polysaccharolyticus]MBE8716499.1 SCPU domain-containing protein [Cellvibrio polysaccharolyticus]
MERLQKFHHCTVMKLFLIIAFIFPASSLAVVLNAPTTTTIRMSIVGGCEFSNAPVQNSTAMIGTMNFGSVYHAGGPVEANSAPGQGSIQFRCTPGVTARVTMNAGLYSATVNNRRMRHTNTTNYLSYQLYTTANRNVIWDATTGRSLAFSNDTLQTMTVYGRLPPQSGVLPGTYTDTVTVTITW